MAPKKLFSGLSFYFYPDRTLSRINGVKASACARFGAKIDSDLNESTTHILLSKSHDSPAFRKLVSRSSISEACIIASSDWPSECIETGELIDIQPFVLDKPQASAETKEEPSAKRAKIVTNPPNKDDRTDIAEVPTQASSLSDSLAAVDPNADPNAAPKSSPDNQMLIEVFHDFAIARETAGEEFSARIYQRAVRSLEETDLSILTPEDALQLPGFTKRLAALVGDIQSGKFSKVLSQSAREKAHIIQLFSTVYGVGGYNARKLYKAGYRTLEDIKDKVDENGRVSIEHHQDFVERISRTEVEKHYLAVKSLLADIDPDLDARCMGSYRRQKLDCGDIDIILTKPDVEIRELKLKLEILLKRMYEIGLAKYTFSRGEDRWLGATQVISKWRRMDILLVPWKELGAAMMYYTGDDTFNRKMRLLAKQKGMRLSGQGLYKLNALGETELLEGHDERRIFELLGVTWREPKDRNL